MFDVPRHLIQYNASGLSRPFGVTSALAKKEALVLLGLRTTFSTNYSDLLVSLLLLQKRKHWCCLGCVPLPQQIIRRSRAEKFPLGSLSFFCQSRNNHLLLDSRQATFY